VVICLERGADLHMAQLMPLPLTVSCFSKIQIGFIFLVPAHPIVPEKGPLNVCSVVVAILCNGPLPISAAAAAVSNDADSGVCSVMLRAVWTRL